jgi:hypothetical protein
MELPKIIEHLNQWQTEGLIKITNYENLTISLRPKLKKEITTEIDEWIVEWSKLWNGKKSNGYYLANPPKDNAEKMKAYMKDHPDHTTDIIMQATKNYLNEKAKEGYAYTKKSNLFIHTQGQSSTLYAYCLAVINGDVQESKERVKAI